MGAWLSKQQASPAPASSPPPCWSGLPPELADIVLRRLPSLADRARFASACRHWRHVATQYSPSPPGLPPALPWLNFHDGSFRSLPDGEPHSFPLGEDTLCGGSSGCGGWVLLRRPWSSSPSRRHFLQNPLLGTTLWFPGQCREPVDLNSYGSRRPVSTSTRFFISKVIVCSEDLIAATVNYHITGPCAVVCCRPVMSSWSAGLRDGRRYKDMALYKGKLHTVTDDGSLFAHEVTEDTSNGEGEPRVSRIEQVIKPPGFRLEHVMLDEPYFTLDCVKTCYLVISRDHKLLMVLRWIVVPCRDCYRPEQGCTPHMTLKVFEADLEMRRWVEVKSLGDQVLFVSPYSSKAISSDDCGYLRGNQIYFIDDSLITVWRLWPSSKPRTSGVYDMSSGTMRSISLGGLVTNDQAKGSWFFPC
ncbi:uncharacterized protein LOC120645906 [Panicum virgatum]|nr:uncharacterized protein LOC120645906 [Panicum virgatum]